MNVNSASGRNDIVTGVTCVRDTCSVKKKWKLTRNIILEPNIAGNICVYKDMC